MTSPLTIEPSVRHTRKPRLVAFAALAVVLMSDQVAKNLAIQRLIDGPIDILGPWRLRLVANRGAVLGIPAPTWLLFAAFGVVGVIALLGLRRTTTVRIAVGYGLVVGGGAGNMVDRFMHRPRFPSHAVVDWIGSSVLPTFNLADVAILFGIILLATASGRVAS